MIISAACEARRLKQGNDKSSKEQMRRLSRHWYTHTLWVAGLGQWLNQNPGQLSFFFFSLLSRKGTRLSWPAKAKLPQPFVASKAEYRLSLSGCVTQSTFVVYLQQWVKGTALSYVWWWGARRRAVVGGGSAVFLNFHFWFSAELETRFYFVIFF